MGLSFKKNDQLDKMLEDFAVIPDDFKSKKKDEKSEEDKKSKKEKK